jgi:hypothetical protein
MMETVLMKKQIALALGCFLLINVSYAGKLYKVVDENGKVTFSQYPPTDKSKNQKVESLAVNSWGTTAVTQSGTRFKCGDILLPSKPESRLETSQFLQRVDYKADSWRSQLARLEAKTAERSRRKLNNNHSNYSTNYKSRQSSYYLEQQSRDTQKMRDLRCAVEWAQSAHSDVGTDVGSVENEKVRLLAIKEKLENRLQEQCGELAAYDPTNDVAVAKRKHWYSCSKDHRREIKVIDRKLRRFN